MYENLITKSKRGSTIDNRPEQDRAVTTRQEILASAEHIFFEKGAAATTLEQIAEKANVTRGAVYYHFRNKNDLLEHMLDSAILPALDAYRAELAETAEPNFEQLRKASIAVVLTIVRSPEMTRRLSIALLKCEYTDEFAYLIEKQTRYHDETRDLMISYFTRMKNDGIRLAKSPALMAEALLFFHMGMIIQFFKHPDRLDMEENVANYFDIFFGPLA